VSEHVIKEDNILTRYGLSKNGYVSHGLLYSNTALSISWDFSLDICNFRSFYNSILFDRKYCYIFNIDATKRICLNDPSLWDEISSIIRKADLDSGLLELLSKKMNISFSIHTSHSLSIQNNNKGKNQRDIHYTLLGTGSCGTAMLVIDNSNGKEYVLKFANNKQSFIIEEYNQLQKLYQICPDHVVKVVPYSCHCIDADIAGYLMEDIGQPILSPLTDPDTIRKIIYAMFALHVQGQCHGSCRIDNIIAH
jgi:hypothetical protein